CYAPVCHFTSRPKPTFSFDLHVLGPPLTFALSQDQTLQLNFPTEACASAGSTFEITSSENHDCRGIRRTSPVKAKRSSYLSNLVCYSAFRDRREKSLSRSGYDTPRSREGRVYSEPLRSQ